MKRSDIMKKTAYLIIVISGFIFLMLRLCKSISEIKRYLNHIYSLDRTCKPEIKKQTFDLFIYIITTHLYTIIFCALFIGILLGAFFIGIYIRNQNKVDSPKGEAP
jgi:uncharacterized BrkB/YihY/UPF0761 family membrane protein